MVVEVRWYDAAQRVALMRFPAEFDWEDFRAAKRDVERLLDTVAHPCALILQFAATIPPLTDMLSQGRAMLASRHPRAAHFILVTDSVFLRGLGTMLNQISSPNGRLIEVAATLAEAEQRLARLGFLPASGG